MTVAVLELLYFDGCPSHAALLPHLQRLLADAGLDVEVRLRRVTSEDEAQRLRFLGSPSIRVDGHDIEPGASGRRKYGLQCRLYVTPQGLAGAPPDALILNALTGGEV